MATFAKVSSEYWENNPGSESRVPSAQAFVPVLSPGRVADIIVDGWAETVDLGRIDKAGGATSYLVARTGATHQFKVRVHRTGRVELCDAASERATDPDRCL